jgi:hypothetical protein
VTSLARVDEVIATAARLRGAGVRVFVAATGAGAGMQEALWRVPGCSAFFAGATFCYAAAETEALLGFRPERFASDETAVDLATAAYLRAIDPDDPRRRPIGLGLTASVATTAEHRGEHRVHVAAVGASLCVGRSLVLPKGAGSERRRVDGDAADELGLGALFDAAGVARDTSLEDWTALARARLFARPYWDAAGRRAAADAIPEGAPLFPGAFDPPHEGHFAIASTDRGHARPAVFTVCATPPHKPPLTVGDMLRRARALAGHARLFTEGDPLYIDKARRFPGRTFLVGADALARMLDPRWGTPVGPMLDELARLGARFRVSARVVDGVETTLAELIDRVPPEHREMFAGVTGRWDVSSTELRARGECA